MSNKIKFTLNSAVTDVDPETGAFLKDQLEETGKRIRAHIMGQTSGDGIANVYVYRYGIEVEYISEAISREAVIAAVQAGVAWAVENVEGSFPLRADKKVEALVDCPRQPQPTGKWRIVATPSTYVLAYPAGDPKDYMCDKVQLADELAQLDGVVDCKVDCYAVSLTVDSRYVTTDAAMSHVWKVLFQHINNKSSRVFPFADGHVEVEWETYEIKE